MPYFINIDIIDIGSRYDMARFLEFSQGTFDTETSYFIDNLMKLSPEGVYSVSSEDSRPDLLSHRIYGETQYWWILMLFNGILNPTEDLKTGMTIKYPSINDMESIYFQLMARSQL